MAAAAAAVRMVMRRVAAAAPAAGAATFVVSRATLARLAAGATTLALAGAGVALTGNSPSPKELKVTPVIKDAAYYQGVCVHGGSDDTCPLRRVPSALTRVCVRPPALSQVQRHRGAAGRQRL